jgi:hypothetical protein
MEQDTTTVAIRQFSDVSNDDDGIPYVLVDWNPWNEFNKDFGPSFSQTIPVPIPQSNDVKNKIPLWQRLPKDTEPILVPCNVRIPTRFTSLKDEKKVMHLSIAYVTDQDGFVVGKYFKPSKFNSDDESTNNNDPSKGNTASENGAISSTKTTNSSDDKEEVDSDDAYAEIACIILPGETKSIVATAYYGDEINLDKDEEEAAVYKKEYDLYKMLIA